MNTDVVEWFFGNCRQFVVGRTTKLTVCGWNAGDFKASAVKAATHNVVGNNKSVDDMLKREKRI